MAIDILSNLELSLKSEDRPPASIRQYLWIAKRFFEFTGDKEVYNSWDVRKFLVYLQENNTKPSFRRTAYYILKYLYGIMGWGWEFGRKSAPKVSDDDIFRPAFKKEEVIGLIKRAKSSCEKNELAYLSLSTTYGLRRVELTSIRKEDVDIVNNSILIHTRKQGRTVSHLLPEEIKPWIIDYDFPPITERACSLLFWMICAKVGLNYGNGYSWHSIRRALVTGLLEGGLDHDTIRRFMRWKERGDIVSIYDRREQSEIDAQVFKVHPFLPIWR